jgi:hypothetical protein
MVPALQQVLQGLAKRMESKRDRVRMHYRHRPRLEKPAPSLSQPREEEVGLLGEEEVLLTVGIMRFGHPTRMHQVLSCLHSLTSVAWSCPPSCRLAEHR